MRTAGLLSQFLVTVNLWSPVHLLLLG